MKAKVMRITLERAEGPTSECGQPKVVESFAHADTVLWGWATTAPKRGGGYDKCDFVVLFDNGDTYKGRFDLQREDQFRTGLLQTHINDSLTFMAGLRKPDHMTQERYVAFLVHAGHEAQDEAREMLETCDIDICAGRPTARANNL